MGHWNDARPRSAELLDAWERVRPCAPTERGTALLAATGDDVPSLTIGERDARLMTLREELFGSRLHAVVHCVRCGDRFEMTLDVADLRVPSVVRSSADEVLEVDGVAIRFRMPTAVDVASAARARDADDFRRRLFEICITDARRDGETVALAEVPAPVLARLAERMDELDPQADVRLALACPACEHAVEARFDIAAFLWAELDAWAQRLLDDVHALATAYGWSERDVLSMTPVRRRFYVERAVAR